MTMTAPMMTMMTESERFIRELRMLWLFGGEKEEITRIVNGYFGEKRGEKIIKFLGKDY